MNYEEALNYIHAVQWAGHKPGLTRTRTLLAALGDPHKQLRFIHVAGTNGKGSTAAMVSAPSTAPAVGRLAACAMATPGFTVRMAPA